MIRKKLKTGILVSIFFSSLLLYAQVSPDIERIQRKGKLVVGVYRSDVFPLFYHDRNSRLCGSEIDLAMKIAGELGVRLVINREAGSYDRIIEFVADRTVDLGISEISETPERATKVRFSDPYLILHPVAVTRRVSKLRIDNEDSFLKLDGSGLTAVEMEGTSYKGIVGNILPHITVREVPDWDTAIREVYDGTADMVLRDEIGIHNFIQYKKELLVGLQLCTLAKVNDYIAIAINSDDMHFEHWINIVLRQNNYPISAAQLWDSYE